MLSAHEVRVREMMVAFRQRVPSQPEIPDLEMRKLRVRLLVEEVLETAEAYGIEVGLNIGVNYFPIDMDNLAFVASGEEPDLVKIIDGHGDISVVNVGGAAACGVELEGILEQIDANNLAKVTNGHVCPDTGKFIKPEGHPAPPIAEVLEMQGYQNVTGAAQTEGG